MANKPEKLFTLIVKQVQIKIIRYILLSSVRLKSKKNETNQYMCMQVNNHMQGISIYIIYIYIKYKLIHFFKIHTAIYIEVSSVDTTLNLFIDHLRIYPKGISVKWFKDIMYLNSQNSENLKTSVCFKRGLVKYLLVHL